MVEVHGRGYSWGCEKDLGFGSRVRVRARARVRVKVKSIVGIILGGRVGIRIMVMVRVRI